MNLQIGCARTLALITIPTFLACGGDTSPGSAADAGVDRDDAALLDVNGALVGDDPPASARVVVLWQVTSGSPDYLYKFGEGTSSDASFVLRAAAPPVEAINAGGVGVGLLLLVEADTEIAVGVLDPATLDALDPHLLGVSRDAVIWVSGSASDPGWAERFAPGYSCGACVTDPTGSFDTFEPGGCSSMVIHVGDLDAIEICNWT
jgi:hypothetical protein